MARPKKQIAKTISKKRGPKAKAKVATKITAVKAVKKIKVVTKKSKIKQAAPSFTATLKNLAAEALKHAGLLSNEIDALRVKADKANAKLKDAKNSRNELLAKAKTKATAALKKQVAKAKDAFQTATNVAEQTQKELDAKRKEHKTAKDESTKFKALIKVVQLFEKDWAAAKKATEAKPAKAPKVKTAKKATGAKRGRKPAKATAEISETAHHSFETAESDMAAEPALA